MKRLLIPLLVLALLTPAWAAQTPITTIDADMPSIGALKGATNTKLGTIEANRMDHEGRIGVVETGKIDINGLSVTGRLTRTGSGTTADPYIITGTDQFLVQSNTPSATNIVWFDTTDAENVLCKVYITDEWVTIAGSATPGGTEYTLPIATAEILGGVKVGDRLTIDPVTGVLSADVQSGAVTSVNGDTGVVVLGATDIAISDLDELFTASSVETALAENRALINAGGVGDNLGAATASNVADLFSGTGTYLQKDGSSGDPVIPADIGDLTDTGGLLGGSVPAATAQDQLLVSGADTGGGVFPFGATDSLNILRDPDVAPAIGDAAGWVDVGGVATLNFDAGSGTGLPDCAPYQITMRNAIDTEWVCIDFASHPDYVTLLSAFNAAGLNSWTFDITSLGTDTLVSGTYYQNSEPFPVSVTVADSSSTYDTDGVDFIWNSGAPSAMTESLVTPGLWEIAGITGADGDYTVQFYAYDDKTTPNDQYSGTYNVTIDTTDPVVADNATSATHDGTANISLDFNVTDVNLDVADVTYNGNAGTYTGAMSCTGTAPNHNCTASVDPLGLTSDITFSVLAYDLAGNSGSSGEVVVGYSGGVAGCNTPVLELTTTPSGGSTFGQSANAYAGNKYSGASTISGICKARVGMWRHFGNIDSHTFYARAFQLGGSSNITPASPVATSTGIPGTEITGTSEATLHYVDFEFATPFDLPQNYAITIESDTISTSNYARLLQVEESSGNFARAVWNETGTHTALANAEFYMILYTE